MRRFGVLLRLELRKSLALNGWFWGALGVGVFLAVVSAARSWAVFDNTLALALENWNSSDFLYSAASAFSFWMLINPYEFAPGVFVMLWPLLSAVSYAWSWWLEKENGVMDQVCARFNRIYYIFIKLIAVFVSGALVVVVPVVVNLIGCLCFAPASPVWVSDVLFVGVQSSAPLSSLFYTNTPVFCLLWMLVVALVGGLWATTVLSISMLTGRFLETVAASYLFLQGFAFFGGQLSTLAAGYGFDDALSSALFSFDLFSIVSVRSLPGSGAALVCAVFLLLIASALIPLAMTRRDIL